MSDATATTAGATPVPGPILSVRDLSVSYTTRGSDVTVVSDVSFDVGAGEVVAVVGESGSGKTTTAQAVIGLLAENGRIDSGSILLNGTDIAGWSPKRLQSVRGKRIALIPQDPNNSLNPVKTIGANLAEVLRIHHYGPAPVIRARVIELLERVGIPEPERRAKQYPHELSGGMKQRVLIASAIALEPELIIADEATSALDVTVQKRILDLLDDLRRELGTAILFVTHDLAVAADRASRILVMRAGTIQEQGDTAVVLANPATDYTKTLLSDAPSMTLRDRDARAASRDRVAAAVAADRVVSVTDLVQQFGSGKSAFRAVDGVSFDVVRGTTHAIVGESGSGKTTVARAVAGFSKPTAGAITLDGVDVAGLKREQLRQFRRRVQLVYQNPFSSLDPRQTVEKIVTEPLDNFSIGDGRSRRATVAEFIDRVALPSSALHRLPRELSGGQRQRVAIARALVLHPEVVVLDEAVSALDVTVQAQILALLETLQGELGLTYLFISHDLAVVRHIADTISVMQTGRIVESGSADAVFDNPTQQYTRDLLDAIPGRHLGAGALEGSGALRSTTV
ncbi:MAG: glutathione transporter ATP-binding protein [Glaciihabitans sp.]|nr:glutathione transporter ATP-binding protein [Glaciihabitans sp.]